MFEIPPCLNIARIFEFSVNIDADDIPERLREGLDVRSRYRDSRGSSVKIST